MQAITVVGLDIAKAARRRVAAIRITDGKPTSQLLQEVKDVLAVTNWSTRIRGEGQVVVVPYNTCELEIVPGRASSTIPFNATEDVPPRPVLGAGEDCAG